MQIAKQRYMGAVRLRSVARCRWASLVIDVVGVLNSHLVVSLDSGQRLPPDMPSRWLLLLASLVVFAAVFHAAAKHPWNTLRTQIGRRGRCASGPFDKLVFVDVCLCARVGKHVSGMQHRGPCKYLHVLLTAMGLENSAASPLVPARGYRQCMAWQDSFETTSGMRLSRYCAEGSGRDEVLLGGCSAYVM